MSQITYADKTGSTASNTNQWVAADANEVKVAVNSKMDRWPTPANIAARDALTGVQEGQIVRVLDASADADVDSGWAAYQYISSAWVLVMKEEALAASSPNLSATTGQTFAGAVALNNLFGTYYNDWTLADDGALNLSSIAAGAVIGGVAYIRVIADGAAAVNLGGDFTQLYGITDGEVLDAGTYEFYIQKTPSGAVVSVPANGGNSTTVTQLATPANVTATAASDTAITIDWDDVANADDYVVERSADGSTGWLSVGTPATSTFQNTGLTAATQYFYRVRARGGEGFTDSDYSAVANATTNAGDSTAPTIVSFDAIAEDNSYVDVTFSEGVYGADDGSTVLAPSDLQITNFTQNGGGITAIAIDSLTQVNGDPLAGGETEIRVNLTPTGTGTGVETFQIRPADGASVYDAAGNAMAAGQTTGTITASAANVFFASEFDTTEDALMPFIDTGVNASTITESIVDAGGGDNAVRLQGDGTNTVTASQVFKTTTTTFPRNTLIVANFNHTYSASQIEFFNFRQTNSPTGQAERIGVEGRVAGGQWEASIKGRIGGVNFQSDWSRAVNASNFIDTLAGGAPTNARMKLVVKEVGADTVAELYYWDGAWTLWTSYTAVGGWAVTDVYATIPAYNTVGATLDRYRVEVRDLTVSSDDYATERHPTA